MLNWDAPNERYFQHGVDRGVLYIGSSDPVAWNGLTGVEEAGGGSSDILYRDGKIYLADVNPGNFEGTITAYFFPDEFSKCLGIPEAAEGLYVDNQKPKQFGVSYRSLIGSGTAGDMFGYQIHLVYKAMAMFGTRQRRTLGNTPEPMEFSFGLVCTPVKMTGFRPSAHYILDTRHMDATLIAQLEALLYGTDTEAGRLPTPLELFELMNFGDTITVTDIGDDMFTITGARQYVVLNPDGSFTVTNINAEDNGDGTYDMTTGGNTVVIEP